MNKFEITLAVGTIGLLAVIGLLIVSHITIPAFEKQESLEDKLEFDFGGKWIDLENCEVFNELIKCEEVICLYRNFYICD